MTRSQDALARQNQRQRAEIKALKMENQRLRGVALQNAAMLADAAAAALTDGDVHIGVRDLVHDDLTVDDVALARALRVD